MLSRICLKWSYRRHYSWDHWSLRVELDTQILSVLSELHRRGKSGIRDTSWLPWNGSLQDEKHCLSSGHLVNLFEEGQLNTRFQLSLSNSPPGWKVALVLVISRTVFPEIRPFPSVYCKHLNRLKNSFTRFSLHHTHISQLLHRTNRGSRCSLAPPHAHPAIPCPDWGLSKGSRPPGKEMWAIALSPAAWRAQASLTLQGSAAGSGAKLRSSWAAGGCLEPQLWPGGSMEGGHTGSKSTNTLRTLLLLFHYWWKDKLNFHLTTHPGLIVTN